MAKRGEDSSVPKFKAGDRVLRIYDGKVVGVVTVREVTGRYYVTHTGERFSTLDWGAYPKSKRDHWHIVNIAPVTAEAVREYNDKEERGRLIRRLSYEAKWDSLSTPHLRKVVELVFKTRFRT